MTVFWKDILIRFEKANKAFQKESCDLSDVVLRYESLRKYIEGLRSRFDFYEAEGKKLSQKQTYDYDSKRHGKRKKFYDEEKGNDTVFDGKSNMRVNSFLVIINQLTVELEKRAVSYSELDHLFGFLYNIFALSNDDIRKSAKNLKDFYSADLDDDFMEECVYFRDFVVSINMDENKNQQKNFSPSPKVLLKIIREKNVVATFPNVDTALRIFLSILPSNASGETTFSALKRIKNYLRNTTGEERLSSLASLTSNADILQTLDCESIIELFAGQKARKKPL